MEDGKIKCFFCGKHIKESLEQCPYCGAEQVKLLTQEDIDTINKTNTKLKKCVTVSTILGVVTAIILLSISPNSQLFLLGIIIGLATFYGLSSYYDDKK